MNEAWIVIKWIAYVLWKVVVFISFPLIFLFAHQGYALAYRKITGRDYQETGELIRKQAVFRVLFWLSIIALGHTWYRAVDKRFFELILGLLGRGDPAG